MPAFFPKPRSGEARKSPLLLPVVLVALLGAAILATALVASAADPSTTSEAKKVAPTDLEQLARRLVRQSAGVRKGEIVLINGYPQDLELLENIAVHARKVGAFPLVGMNSDRITKRFYEDVPARFDSQTDAVGLELAAIADVTISISGSQRDDLFANADPKRLAARAKASEPVFTAFRRHKVRFVEVGNGLYPTAQRAQRFQMPLAELARTFWRGVNIDYTSLQTRGEGIKRVLAAGNELHITNPNGTDLRVRIQGRPVFVSDGVITSEEIKKGNTGALNVYLPAGEVYVTPVAGTATGTVVSTRDFFEGREIRNLKLRFAAGKLTSVTGSGQGFEHFKASYDAVRGRKDEFAFVDLGINPNIKLAAASRLGNWVPAGTVTVGFGENTWAGGDNTVPFGWASFLQGSTVTLDGRTIIEKGKLKI